ncbi:reverse transcriptase [Corchorus capsularis]|uniref:Reverse transcriptase n=1 Tax=Corchorus capsularis TaxID=210143 RepID=A0A1R3JQ87_COCAP|nr:reverse transcriptase [Corchorus capsularis]
MMGSREGGEDKEDPPSEYHVEELVKPSDSNEQFSEVTSSSEQPIISMHAIYGTTGFQTMRVCCRIKHHKLIILVDSGSTRNFIDGNATKAVGLKVDSRSKTEVTIADGTLVVTWGSCQNLTWHMPTVWDFSVLTMHFQHNGEWKLLQGLVLGHLQLSQTKQTLKQLNSMMVSNRHQPCTLMLAECSQSQLKLSAPDKVVMDLQQLLDKYSGIFEEPRGLPPHRPQDHRIPLKDESKTVKIRPYRHPNIQKNEIEKMVKEMLESGVIRHSSSSFASAIVMVKKKNGSWRMCVDYRQLNQLTIKDKFPIPLIEELLDELIGAKFFTKLDLRFGYYQVRMHTEDVHKTTFKTHEGHYEFLVMPFGLTNAPSTFQSIMNALFKPYLRRKGSSNMVADVLSRKPVPPASLMAISSAKTELWDKIQASWEKDERLQKIIQNLRGGVFSNSKYTWTRGQLHRKGKLVVGNDKELKKELLLYFHSSPFGGHAGNQATLSRISSVLYWKGMRKDVRNMVKECSICQRHKSEHAAPPGLLQPLPIPTKIWEDISMDFIEGLPKSGGKDSILVVVDRLSKYAHFIPLAHPYTAIDVAQAFMNQIFKLHDVKLETSTAYHPQTDGQTEVVNKSLESYLRCMISEKPKEWSFWLPLAEWWYNTNYHSSLNSTPYEVVYGQKPPLHQPYLAGSSFVETVDRSLSAREAALNVCKFYLSRAQNRMKQMADRRRTEREFQVGEWVYVKLQPYRQQTVANRSCLKLSAKYFGPYQITKKVGELPKAVSELPMLSGDGTLIKEPISIVYRRMVKRNNATVTEVLVNWSNSFPEDATWEVCKLEGKALNGSIPAGLIDRINKGLLQLKSLEDDFKVEIGGLRSLMVECPDDKDMLDMATEYLGQALEEKKRLQNLLLKSLLPRDDADERDCILEVRAGPPENGEHNDGDLGDNNQDVQEDNGGLGDVNADDGENVENANEVRDLGDLGGAEFVDINIDVGLGSAEEALGLQDEDQGEVDDKNGDVEEPDSDYDSDVSSYHDSSGFGKIESDPEEVVVEETRRKRKYPLYDENVAYPFIDYGMVYLNIAQFKRVVSLLAIKTRRAIKFTKNKPMAVQAATSSTVFSTPITATTTNNVSTTSKSVSKKKTKPVSRGREPGYNVADDENIVMMFGAGLAPILGQRLLILKSAFQRLLIRFKRSSGSKVMAKIQKGRQIWKQVEKLQGEDTHGCWVMRAWHDPRLPLDAHVDGLCAQGIALSPHVASANVLAGGMSRLALGVPCGLPRDPCTPVL